MKLDYIAKRNLRISSIDIIPFLRTIDRIKIHKTLKSIFQMDSLDVRSIDYLDHDFIIDSLYGRILSILANASEYREEPEEIELPENYLEFGKINSSRFSYMIGNMLHPFHYVYYINENGQKTYDYITHDSNCKEMRRLFDNEDFEYILDDMLLIEDDDFSEIFVIKDESGDVNFGFNMVGPHLTGLIDVDEDDINNGYELNSKEE